MCATAQTFPGAKVRLCKVASQYPKASVHRDDARCHLINRGDFLFEYYNLFNGESRYEEAIVLCVGAAGRDCIK